MKKVFSIYFLSLAFLIGFVCSCSTGPNYGKLIPKDAAFVMSLNVEKAIESSGMEGEEEPQEVLLKLLKKSNFSRATREKLEEVVDDIDEAGLDLREPLMVFYSPTYINEVGLTGAVYDAQKLEDLINAMAREALCNKVNTYGELRYTVMDHLVLAFNDSWFFVTKRKSSQINDEAVLDEIEGLFMQDEEKSLYGTDSYEKMSDGKGFVQVLLQGDGLRDALKKYPDFKNIMAGMPQNVDLKDFAYLCDLSLNKGEILLTGETLMLSDEAEEWLETFEGYGQIAGDFNAYLPADAIFQIVTNVNGADIFKQLEANSDLVTEIGEEQMEMLKKMMANVKGDCAFFIDGMVPRSEYPEMSLYVQTENADWVDLALSNLPQSPDSVGVNEYSLALYRNNDARMANFPPEAYAKFGTRGGVSYIQIGKSPEPFRKVKEAQHAGDGKNVYMRLNIADLMDLDIFKKSFGRMEGMIMKKVVAPFDYAEMYTENKTKMTFRVVMKNKEESPVKVIYDQVFGFAKNFL